MPDLKVPQQAANTKAAAGCRSPELLRIPILFCDQVVFKTADCLQTCRTDRLPESLSTTPLPVGPDGHEFVMYGVLVDVIQSCEITSLMREVRFTKVLPQPGASRFVIAMIEFLRRQAVQFPYHRTE